MCRLVLVTTILLAILFGFSGLYMMPKSIRSKIESRIQLKIGTKTFDRFTRIPIPLTVKFYFFNVTNSQQVLAGLERPKFQEVGPFMFKQWRRREIVDFLDHNRKITYREVKTYYPMYPQELINTTSHVYYNLETEKFSTSNSDDIDNDSQSSSSSSGIDLNLKQNASEGEIVSKQLQNEDKKGQQTIIKMLNPYKHNITLINVPLLSVLTKLAQQEEGTLKRSLAAKVVSRLIDTGAEKILITRAANQFMFDGYKVGLMEATTNLISNTLGFNFESPLPRNKFGFFHTKNGTWSRREAGEVTIFTGRNNSMDQFMMVDNWNGMSKLNVWPTNTEAGDRCNQIRGTDGSQFRPGVTKQQVLNIFSPMICTSIYLKFKEDTSARGIPLMRFVTPPDVFAAPKKNPQNACYCTMQQHQEQTKVATTNYQQAVNGFSNNAKSSSNSKARLTNARCYIDGLMDLSLCQRGAPIAASGPHFYNSDPMLALAAGLQPSKDKHETYLDVEPMTGSVMRAASRAQLSAFVEQAALDVVDPQLIGHMTPMIAPLLWLEETAQIDEKSSIEFKNLLLNVVQKARLIFILSIVIGVILALLVAIQYWYVTCYRGRPVSKRQADLDEQETTAQRRARLSKEQELSEPRTRIKNSRKFTGARRANLAGRQPLILDDAKQELGTGGSSQGKGKHLQASTVAMSVAAALGAADAAATANNRLSAAERSRAQQRRADYEQQDDEDDDETLSRRALVASEWPVPGKEGQTNSGPTSSAPSTIGVQAEDYDKSKMASSSGTRNDIRPDGSDDAQDTDD